jgi:hypothetical protein
VKTKRFLIVAMVIGVIALILAGYCFWLMTVPLSYDLVVPVVIGFLCSLFVFVIAVISSIIIAIRLRRSRAPRAGQITPTV